MTRAANIVDEIAAAEIKTALAGKKCWYAYSTCVSTVGLALGRRVPRVKPLRSKSHTEEYRRFEGELHLIIWCSWRLDKGNAPLISSDGDEQLCHDRLGVLIGRTAQAVQVSPSWNLQIGFSGGFVLIAFPDHVGESANFDGNWELWRQDQAYLVGTDLTCEVIDRENRPLRLRSRRGRWTVAGKAKSRPRNR